MENPRIYFDIDKTLVDTRQLMRNFEDALMEVGFPSETFAQTLQAYRATLKDNTEFDPEIFLDALTDAHPGDHREQLAQAFWLAHNFEQALFPDALMVLGALSQKLELGVFSQGVKAWQEKKLQLAGLDHFFPEERRIIESNKLSEAALAQLPQDAWVIDDKKPVVTHLKTNRPDLRVLWINRETPEETDLETITSLLHIVALYQAANPG